MSTLTTTERPTTELRPHPRNPRNGDTAAIARSLTLNGQYRPIVTTTDGTILAGNHTYMAAMELGWAHIACVTLDIDPDSPQAHRIMLADNRTADLGGYDDGLLLDLLKELDRADGGLSGTGYDEDDLLRLLEQVLNPRDIDAELGLAQMDRIDPLTCPNCGYVGSPGSFKKAE